VNMKDRIAALNEDLAAAKADGHRMTLSEIRQAQAATRDTAAKPVSVGALGRIKFDGRSIHLKGATYPAAGARAEVSDFRSGLGGRKHTTDITVTLASGEVLTWHQTDSGMGARRTHNEATRFAAAVNSAA
jgi:hypothetical protein